MAWGFVQSFASQAVSSGSSGPAAPTSVYTAGTKLIAWVSTDVATTGLSVSDSLSNAFSLLATVAQGTPGAGSLYMYVLDTPAGDVGTHNAVTASASGSNHAISIVVEEWSGLLAGSTTAIFDGSAGTLGAATSGAQGPPTYASTASNELLLYAYGDDGGGTTTSQPGSPYTSDANGFNGTSNSNMLVSYKNSTSGTEAGQFTVRAGEDWAMLMVAIKLAGGGGGVAVPAPAWKPQARRTTPVRGRAGRSLVAAGIIGAVGVTSGHAPRPYPVSHPAPQRAQRGPLGRNAAGIRGPVNHAAAAVPLGTSMPRVPHPRPQRVLWHGQAGPGNQSITVVAVGPPAWHAQPRRTPPQRAIARGVTGPPNHGYASPPGVQPQIRHPKPQRALWRGLTAPGPRPGPVPQRFLPPRPVKPQRAIWRGVTGVPQSVSGIAVPAPKLLRQPPRRPALLRAIWRHITGPGNATAVVPQQGTVTVTATPAATATISVTPAATVSITSQAAGTVTITSTTAGTATISNQQAGTVTIVNEL